MTSFLTPAHRRLAAFCLLLPAFSPSARAVDLKIDVNDRDNNTPANTELGFQTMAMAASPANAQSIATSATFGAQTVTITATGTYDDRKRVGPVNGGVSFNQQALMQDFVFALYSASNVNAGLDISITGLTAGKQYVITVWSFDDDSNGTRVSDWSVNGVLGKDNYTFNGTNTASTNAQFQINLNGTADGTGKVVISARRDPTSVDAQTTPQPSHGVYLNALWIRDLFEDTDNDNMGDGWETSHGLNVGVNDAGLDPDNDFSTNLQEFTADTDPQDNDSDNDSLLDGYEKKTGTWVSATDTGTNPLNPDSDVDGLGDAVEYPDLPWLSPAQPGTNPNIYDSDSDGFSDGEEVTWPTNPRLTAEFPNPAAGSTLAVDLENTAAVPQPGFLTMLGSATDVPSFSAQLGAYNVTISGVGSTTLQSRDRAAAAGGKGFNPLFRDFIFSQNSADDNDGLDVTITGLTPHTWYPVTLWSWDPSSVTPARRSTWSASEGDVQVVKVPVYVLDNATPPSGVQDRRMKFDALTNAAGQLIIQGRKETGYVPTTPPSVNVILNGFIIGPPVTPPQFTAIAGSQFTFTSDDIGIYEVRSSTDLLQWQTIAPAVDGLPGATTFIDPAPAGPRVFYQVRRVSP